MTALFLLGQVSGGNIIGSERWTGGGTSGLMLVTLILFLSLGLGAWYFNWRTKNGGGAKHGNLMVLETRPLGGRQFLMVAAYGGERFLLSVCPGRVEYLCALPALDAGEGGQNVPGGSDVNVPSTSFSELLARLSISGKNKV